MNLEEMEIFEDGLPSYDFRHYQDFVQFLEALKQAGRSIKDVYSYVEIKRKAIEKALSEMTRDAGPSQQCPECPAVMFLLLVNDKPETQTGDPTDRSVWLCQNNRCLHTIYNKETITEITKAGGT